MDLVAEFQFLSEKTKNSNFTKSTDKGLWEDKSLQSKCRANPLDTNLSMSTKFKIATTFYNWYLVGNTNLDYGFRDALIQALSLACIPDDHWHMTSIFDFSGAQSWYGTLTSTKGLCKNPNKTHRLTELEAKRLYASKNDGIEQIQTTLDDEAVSAHGTLTELYQRLLKLFLEAKAAGQPVSFDRGQRVMFYRYINTAAYLAACAFRLVGKDAETAATIYTKENFRKNIASFGGWVGTSFPRPCTSFVEHLKTGVKRTDSAIMHAFRHIVSVHTKDEVHQLARGFVDSACLLHLKFNGMGAARLLIEAIDVSNLSFSDLMRHMFTESTRSSWRTLATCLNTYHSPDSPHMSKTWSWGKVCDDQYLTYLKPINHVALCAMLHGLLHTGSPKDYESIGEAAWVGQTSRAKYNSHFNYGVNVYNRRCLDIQAMPWNKDLLNSETPVVSAAHDDIKDLQEKEELLTGKKADKTFEKFSEPITEVPDMPDIGEVQNNLIDLEGSLNSTHYLDVPSKSNVVPSAPPLVDRSTSPGNEDLMDLGDEEDQGDDDDDLSGLV